MLTGHETAQLDRLVLGTAAAHAAASVAGLRHARARGYGLETADHRPYQPGDDPRQIDWNAEARLHQLAVRVLQSEGQAHVHLLVDVSRSMAPKLPWVRKVAAALAYITIARRDLAGLTLFSEGIQAHVPATRGRAHLHQLFARLDAAEAAGGSSLTRAFTEVAYRVRPPAFVIVISDFFTPGFGLDGLRAMSARGLDPAVLQVVSDDDAAPPIEDGDLLTDLETPGTVRANVARYRERFIQMTSDLGAHCLAHGMPWLQLRPSMRLEHALDAMIHAGVLAGRR